MNWHDIEDAADPKLDELAAQYRLHSLHVEDCRHRNQRAKVEESEGYLFLVLKAVDLHPDGELNIGDLDVFLGPDWVITVQENDCPNMRRLLEEIRKRQDWQQRADVLAYRLMDGVVDSYLPLLDVLNDKIDTIEDEVLETPQPEMLERIFGLKRSLIELRRVMTNMRDVMGHLQRTDNPLVSRDLWPFLRDVYDHVARNLDGIEMQRDLLSGALDIYLSSVANRTNQVMKVLTVLGTIALPALVISGFYGMNVKDLPWAGRSDSVLIVIAMMAGSTGILLWMLRKFGWF